MGGCETNKQYDGQEANWINFIWAPNKSAIFLPVKINNIPDKFKAQLDLGAITTEIYANTFKPYLTEHPELYEKIDTINSIFSYNGNVVGQIKGIDLKLGNLNYKNQTLSYHTNYGLPLTLFRKEKSIPIIGTIAPDLFKNKFLVIDFKNHRIAVLDSLNNSFNKINFVKIRLDMHRIKVPLLIDGKEKYFMFDTGSSLFPMAVYKDNWGLIRELNSKIDTITVNSWGKPHTFFGAKIKSTVQIGDYKIEIDKFKVYCDTLKVTRSFYTKEKIFGIIGNSFFLDKTIIIDYKNKRFGIITSANNGL